MILITDREYEEMEATEEMFNKDIEPDFWTINEIIDDEGNRELKQARVYFDKEKVAEKLDICEFKIIDLYYNVIEKKLIFDSLEDVTEEQLIEVFGDVSFSIVDRG